MRSWPSLISVGIPCDSSRGLDINTFKAQTYGCISYSRRQFSIFSAELAPMKEGKARLVA